MPHETSLALSLAICLTYAFLLGRHYARPPSRGRTFVVGIMAALFCFWVCRVIGYSMLLTETNIDAVNQVLRWSAYAVALPAVWVLVMDWRMGR